MAEDDNSRDNKTFSPPILAANTLAQNGRDPLATPKVALLEQKPSTAPSLMKELFPEDLVPTLDVAKQIPHPPNQPQPTLLQTTLAQGLPPVTKASPTVPEAPQAPPGVNQEIRATSKPSPKIAKIVAIIIAIVVFSMLLGSIVGIGVYYFSHSPAHETPMPPRLPDVSSVPLTVPTEPDVATQQPPSPPIPETSTPSPEEEHSAERESSPSVTPSSTSPVSPSDSAEPEAVDASPTDSSAVTNASSGTDLQASLAGLTQEVRMCTTRERGYFPRALTVNVLRGNNDSVRLGFINPPTPPRVAACISGLLERLSFAGTEGRRFSYRYEFY